MVCGATFGDLRAGSVFFERCCVWRAQSRMCSSGGGGPPLGLSLSVTGSGSLSVPISSLLSHPLSHPPPHPPPHSLRAALVPGGAPPCPPPPPPLPLLPPLIQAHPACLPPPDPRLVDAILAELKSQGIFDQFRKECISDVDTKPAYQNLRQRVEGSVAGFLSSQTWSPDLNKNQVREKLRKHILDSNFLDQGVERIVDQVVNPKISSVFIPQVEEIFYKYLGIRKPEKFINDSNGVHETSTQLETSTDDLLPNDLESVSPESAKSFDKSGELVVDDVKSPLIVDLPKSSIKVEKEEKAVDQSEDSVNSNDEEFESPAFEPLEDTLKEEGCSKDSHLSGISDLTSHDSNVSSNADDFKAEPDVTNKIDTQNNNSQLSQVSSDSNLSIEIAKESKENVKINFENTFSSIKNYVNSSNACAEPMDTSDTVNKQNFHKYDDGDNSSDARQCFEETSERHILEPKSSIVDTSVDEVYYKNRGIETDDIEMAKSTSSNEAVKVVTQRHRDSVESKTSTDSVKVVGSAEMSLDSSESNGVFTPNVKQEPEILKNVNSFENKIKSSEPIDSINENSNSSIKNNETNSDVFETSEVITKLPAEDKNKESPTKNRDSENKNSSSKTSKERERHSSSSSGKDKDRKDSKSYSRSHSRHSSGRHDSERRHSSSHDKKEGSSSTNKNSQSGKDSHSDHKSRDKQRKSSTNGDSRTDSYREKHGSSGHRSSGSHKSSKYSSDSKHDEGHKSKYSSSDRTSRSEFKEEDRYKKDSSSKNISKTEGSKDSGSHSKNVDHSESSKGRSSHHSSRKDKPSSRHSHTDKNVKSSSTSDDKKNDEKKNKKSGKEENCSSSSKHNRNRRSTDRDSNDGSGGTGKGSGNPKTSSSTTYSSSQKTKTSNSSGDSNSNGNSSQSDTVTSDTVNITSGKYIKSEFNMFEFGSMGAIKRHNLSGQLGKTADTNISVKSPEGSMDKSPDILISNITSPVRSRERLDSISSPEIPNKKPVIHIDGQLKPTKFDELSLSLLHTGEVLKKPKCASNLLEAIKMMKIRKRMDKNEQKRKQNAILLMEKEQNIPKNSSQAFSGISGPEVQLTCMTSPEKETVTEIKSPVRKESENGVKFFDSRFDEKLTARIEFLKEYISQLESDCEQYELAKTRPIAEKSANTVNGFVAKNLRVNIERIDLSPQLLSPNQSIPYEVQNDSVYKNLNCSYSDLDSSNCDSNAKGSESDMCEKSPQDILEIILGGELSLDRATISFNSDPSIECLADINGITKEKSSISPLASDKSINKPTRLTRKRASTSSHDGKNLENDNKVINHNNNNESITCSAKKRKMVKKIPLAEKDLSKINSLDMTKNCEIRLNPLEISNKMPGGNLCHLSFSSNEPLDVTNENNMNCQEISYSPECDKSIENCNDGVANVPLKLKVEIHESGTNEDNPISSRLKRSNKLLLEK
ncbi:uncharacterized protein LOC143911473 [Arctopsyche grandis]|uniref:uncharacterized protein LOC143911473 n=1 Tax=Arctopsyche grandis TaxID=121162 RepID=UPI00406D80A8